MTDRLDDRIRSLMVQVVEASPAAQELEEIMELRLSTEPVPPTGSPVHPAESRPRRGWPVAVAAAAAVLVLVGGVGLLFNLTESDSPVATTQAEPLSLSVWSVVSHDEAVFGGEGSQTILSVTHGGSGLVAVGSDGGGGPWANNSDTDAAVWTSPDGITWSRVPHEEAVFGGARSQVMSSVVAGGPGLVAVGWDGQGILDDSTDVDAAIWTSVDGDTWSRVPHDEEVFGGAWIKSVTVGGPGLVAVGTEGPWSVGDAAVWTSADGINWSRVPHDESVFGGADLQTINDVTMGGPGLVAVGSDGGTGPWDNNAAATAAVWTSVDGITWFRVPHNETVFGTEGNPLPMLSVTAGGPGLIAVGADLRPPGLAKTPVWTSPDGITWTRVPDDVTFRGAMMDVTVGGPGLVTVGLDGIVWTSVDGITWTSFPDDDAVFGRAGHMFSVITQGPYLVAVGSDGSGTVPDRDAVVWVATLED
jgi:hypothetical protein